MPKERIQTKQAKDEYDSPIIDILKKRVQKQEVMEVLHCNERTARRIITECALHYPVITYSAKGIGYRRAKHIDELNAEQIELEMKEVNKALADYFHRINALKRRMKPLIAWKKVAQKKLKKMEVTNNE